MTSHPSPLKTGVFIGLLIAVCSPAIAHKPSDSYLKLEFDGTNLEGQWDIALRDLDHALGLDADGDGAITWGELRLRHDEIATYAFSHLSIHAGDAACNEVARGHLVDNHTDGAYAVLRFDATCRESSEPLRVTYSLFFDMDPHHKGLMSINYKGGTYTAIFSPPRDTWRFEPAAQSPTQQFLAFFGEGAWHIWIGPDHMLFLLSLLFPAVLALEQNRWRAASGFRRAATGVLEIVTAFTVAHSITLSLAALELIEVPSRFVESTIAASVAFAALNNLYPVVRGRLWLVAFFFGLVHGVGFANVLTDFGLPKTRLLQSLVAFNLGVEAGQLAIVGVFLPLAYRMRHSWAYQVMTMRLGSALIAVVACAWLLERSMGVRIF